ncbi:MAG TPA: tetratricopeptide repeat protein [Acidiferrobacterales bacterium]
MNAARLAIALAALAGLASCASIGGRDTLADLRNAKADLKEVHIEGGIEKAIQSYRRFLEETPESGLTPEALRRLADLKVQREYGLTEAARGGAPPADTGPAPAAGAKLDKPAGFDAAAARRGGRPPAAGAPPKSESDKAFEKRATAKQDIASTVGAHDAALPEGADDLYNANAVEAIALYQKLLAKYPNYERNDQALYNMARAYEELGRIDEAMKVMTRIIEQYPRSRYLDEVQFRRAEYFFTRRKYLDAEDAYKAVAAIGSASNFYEHALYKLGWALYKQELYDDALPRFFGVLDHKVSTGYDFDKAVDEIEKKRVDDTFRVISLSFSNVGGSTALVEHFDRVGRRPYELNVYDNLGEYYVEKRRYHDAAGTYKAFVQRNPFHKIAPHFDMRVIEIYKQGGFPRLVIDASKEYVTRYGLKAEYWRHFDVKSYPDVLAHLKANLRELASYYHALYQDKQFAKNRDENFREALVWYREFLASFPKDAESPVMHYQLADLLLEQKVYGEAAVEYERTAYDYPPHDKASVAGYAAVFAHRENVKVAAQPVPARREVIRSSLRFVDTFPKHDKAALVLGAAADDLFEMKDYALALTVARRLIADYPAAESSIRRAAWLVVAHASFETEKFQDAEEGYVQVLALTAKDDKSGEALIDNLAASVYRQGELAGKAGDHRQAANHFLRIAQLAPASSIRPAAEYDAVAALIELKDWDQAIDVLQAFRTRYPGHKLQPEITKKMALVYKEAGRLATAAAEYERIERESKDDEVRRGALLLAADLYEQAREMGSALGVYRRYVAAFPKPLDLALESRHKIAGVYKTQGDRAAYLGEMRQIMTLDAQAGRERTDRTRYLGATAALALTEPLYDELVAIKLVQPFEKNLLKKRNAMKTATDAFGKLIEYEVGDVTAAATYYLAEIYYHFSRALTESERPKNLNPEELEQYELAIEEKAYPFEEKAIEVHEKNIGLLSVGVYNPWIDKSIGRLATLMPARYAKPEATTGYIDTLGPFNYRSATDVSMR